MEAIGKSSDKILFSLSFQAYISLGVVILLALIAIIIACYYAKRISQTISIPLEVTN